MKKHISLLLIAFLCMHNMYAGDKDIISYKKVTEKHLHVKKHDRLVINNRLGNITVRTWDRNEACIAITTMGRGFTEANARDAQEILAIDSKVHENGNNKIEFITVIKRGKGSGIAGVLEQTEDDYGAEIVTNYDICIPTDMALDITQFCGNVYFIDDFAGSLHLNLDVGRMTANALYGEMKYISIDRTLGLKSSIKYLDNATLDGVTDLSIKEAGDITLNTSRSVNIEYAKTINISGNNYDLHIEKVNDINGVLGGQWAKVYIGTIMSNANLSIINYGNVTFHAFGPQVGRIAIHSENSNLHFSRIDNVSVDISTDNILGMGRTPYYLSMKYDPKPGQKYTGIIGNGNGDLNITAIKSTISF